MTQIRTEKEMFPLVEEWLKSGITQKEFSQKHGLALHLMPYWVGIYRKAHLSHPLHSLLGCCKLQGINAHEYLQDVLQRLPDQPINHLKELLPPFWKTSNISYLLEI